MPLARINFGEVQDPQNVNLLNSKSGLLNPLNPPTKTPFLAHFATKSGPFGRFGWCVTPPPPLRACMRLGVLMLIYAINQIPYIF